MKNFAALLDLEKTPAALPYDVRAYDLEGFRAWLAALGHPDRGQWFVHIAGTKGKGSTAALTESLLLALGFDTAAFTSPHLAHFGERYRLNGVAWTAEEFESALERLNAASQPPWRDALKAPHRFRTAFEFMTMAALMEFGQRHHQLQRQSPPQRQVVCWETGLGGRLDCTNVVEPLVTVITALGRDHTAILGETIEQIANEKAGIIKPHRPVVIARQPPEFADRVLPLLRRRAEALHAPVWLAWETCPVASGRETATGQAVEFQLPNGSRGAAQLPLRGAFQRNNLEAALTAAWLVLQAAAEEAPHVAPGWLDGDSAVLSARLAQGIERCQWPGRLEICLAPWGQALVLDGAHCPLSAGAIAQTLREWRSRPPWPNRGPLEVVWAMQRDKQHREFLQALCPPTLRDLFATIHAYRLTGVRGAPAPMLAQVARELGMMTAEHTSPEAALEAAAATGRHVLAVGTLYTLATLREAWHRRDSAPPRTQPS